MLKRLCFAANSGWNEGRRCWQRYSEIMEYRSERARKEAEREQLYDEAINGCADRAKELAQNLRVFRPNASSFLVEAMVTELIPLLEREPIERQARVIAAIASGKVNIVLVPALADFVARNVGALHPVLVADCERFK